MHTNNYTTDMLSHSFFLQEKRSQRLCLRFQRRDIGSVCNEPFISSCFLLIIKSVSKHSSYLNTALSIIILLFVGYAEFTGLFRLPSGASYTKIELSMGIDGCIFARLG